MEIAALTFESPVELQSYLDQRPHSSVKTSYKGVPIGLSCARKVVTLTCGSRPPVKLRLADKHLDGNLLGHAVLVQAAADKLIQGLG